jgi:lycopene epsilon-cyclase
MQASFHVFGMELLATLEVRSIHQFFDTFFRLPDRYWRGFLASKLSAVDLLVFAMLTFVSCSGHIRAKLMGHLFTSDSGMYMINSYARLFLGDRGDDANEEAGRRK